MTDTIDRVAGARAAPASDDVEPVPRSESKAARHLVHAMAAARVSFTWLGVRRGLTAQQKQEAAEAFSAEARYLSAGKKLLDTSHPAFRAVTAIRTRVVGYWRSVSLPYPEPGIRLIRQDWIEPFDGKLRELQQELSEAVAVLDQQYGSLRSDARRRLGRLFDERDYPPSLHGLFALEWDFPSVQPPEYLKDLSPRLYEQEAARVSARFEQAVTLAEQAFAAELSKLVQHLAERLSGSADGKPKVFRDSAVQNLSEFFQRFTQLSIQSSPQLDELVNRAQRVIKGVGPEDLRSQESLRQKVATQLSAVQSRLEGLLVDKPRRSILRQRPPQAAGGET